MKYSDKDKLEIGREVYHNKISKKEAAKKYELHPDTIRKYMRAYRNENGLPGKKPITQAKNIIIEQQSLETKYGQLAKMNKDELIREVIKERIENKRLKKGYIVKEGGAKKEYMLLEKKSMK